MTAAKDKEQETALATLNTALANMDVALLREIIQGNLAGDAINVMNLEKIKVPGGGSKTWEIPSLGDVESTQAIQGVIVGFTRHRAYWDTPLDQEEPRPPNCSSSDGVTGHGDPGGACANCPFNKWETDLKGGRGKACKEKVFLFLYCEGRIIPLVVQVPATSLKAEFNHRLSLASASLRYYDVVTELTLVPDKVGGNSFSRIKFTVPKGGKLTPEAAARLQQYVAAIQPFLELHEQQEDYDYLDPSDEGYYDSPPVDDGFEPAFDGDELPY